MSTVSSATVLDRAHDLVLAYSWYRFALAEFAADPTAENARELGLAQDARQDQEQRFAKAAGLPPDTVVVVTQVADRYEVWAGSLADMDSQAVVHLERPQGPWRVNVGQE